MVVEEILIFTTTMEVLIKWRSQETSFTQVVSFRDKNISGSMLLRSVLIFIVSQFSTIKMGLEETLMLFKETVAWRHIPLSVKNSVMLSNNPSEDGTKFPITLNNEEEVKPLPDN
jgi:hypothetical protein